MDIPQIHQCAHTMGAAREAKERDNAGNRTDIRKDISPEKKKTTVKCVYRKPTFSRHSAASQRPKVEKKQNLRKYLPESSD